MIKEILKEELGISNKVSLLTLKIKEMINNDFGRIKNNSFYYKTKTLIKNINIMVVENVLSLPFDDVDINVIYYVAMPNNETELKLFLKKYKPECNNDLDNLTIYLPLTLSNNLKIDWKGKTASLQHEAHHLFQIIKRNKPILDADEMVEYNKFCDLANSQNENDRYIGFVFYYAIKAEKEAFANSLYRTIMDLNKESYINNPIDILEEYPTYKNIKQIKSFLSLISKDEYRFNELKIRLDDLNINLDYFFKIANKVIESYIKSFGRIVCKAKNDLFRLNNRLK